MHPQKWKGTTRRGHPPQNHPTILTHSSSHGAHTGCSCGCGSTPMVPFWGSGWSGMFTGGTIWLLTHGLFLFSWMTHGLFCCFFGDPWPLFFLGGGAKDPQNNEHSFPAAPGSAWWAPCSASPSETAARSMANLVSEKRRSERKVGMNPGIGPKGNHQLNGLFGYSISHSLHLSQQQG